MRAMVVEAQVVIDDGVVGMVCFDEVFDSASSPIARGLYFMLADRLKVDGREAAAGETKIW
jgi:hypothetical protein